MPCVACRVSRVACRPSRTQRCKHFCPVQHKQVRFRRFVWVNELRSWFYSSGKVANRAMPSSITPAVSHSAPLKLPVACAMAPATTGAMTCAAP